MSFTLQRCNTSIPKKSKKDQLELEKYGGVCKAQNQKWNLLVLNMDFLLSNRI